jgi:hypothetical protein
MDLLRYFRRSKAPAATPTTSDPRDSALRALSALVAESQARDNSRVADLAERLSEYEEAQQMAGAGPWLANSGERTKDARRALREANPISAQGAFGDIELALQNVEWRREVNLSWTEFSRWGIQQIILISRLYYIKNPILRRLIDVCAAYVFARGVEVSSTDKAANEVLDEFFERNKEVLGRNALIKAERAKDTDGNLFFALFADRFSKGKVTARMLDATEIQEIVADPNDSAVPWYYRRVWTQRIFNPSTGATKLETTEAWYPALDYDPDEQPETIGTRPVLWDCRVLHRKCGTVGQWQFGCPRVYPALDWAKAARRYLEACATLAASLAQFSLTLTTKGGQAALEGIKQQLQTTVSATPGNSLWDTNPTAVNASIFASGPGSKLEAFKTSGAGLDPEKVRDYKLMCTMVKGVPETFLGDTKTGNLATAASLDRPTETVFLEAQEEWVEDLTTISQYVLKTSAGAPSGKLRESLENPAAVAIVGARRVLGKDGRFRYTEASTGATPGKIEIKVTFPSIREGDVPAQIASVCDAMTLQNRGGQVVGIDEKEGVRKLGELVGLDNNDEIVEAMYPESEYVADRSKVPLDAPIGKALPPAGGEPQFQAGQPQQGIPQDKPVATSTEAARRMVEAARELRQAVASLS